MSDRKHSGLIALAIITAATCIYYGAASLCTAGDVIYAIVNDTSACMFFTGWFWRYQEGTLVFFLYLVIFLLAVSVTAFFVYRKEIGKTTLALLCSQPAGLVIWLLLFRQGASSRGEVYNLIFTFLSFLFIGAYAIITLKCVYDELKYD